MKIASAKLNYLKMAPRKVRLVANAIKGLPVNEAEAQLVMNSKKAAEPLLKLLRSAVANSKQKGLKSENLFIQESRVDQGPMLKRQMPRAMGRATMIQKKTSHISLILIEKEKFHKKRFTIVKMEKIKKKKGEISQKNKSKGDESKELKPAEKQGFVKRMFRRKSI
ncbi:MAG: 50S ribosomal protein L22 [Patescibacteria group bacterium]